MFTVISNSDAVLLQHSDNAQQAFSSETATTLHLAIPALEALHKAWTTRVVRSSYERFVPALNAACAKIEDYYDKTTESPAYIMSMGKQLLVLFFKHCLTFYMLLVLDPKAKLEYFKRQWSSELQDQVVKCVEEVVSQAN